MPINYTFDDFIGSQYDTSGGLFTIEQGTNRYCYDGFYIMFSNGGYLGGGSAIVSGDFILTHPNSVAGSYFCTGSVGISTENFPLPFESNGIIFEGVVTVGDEELGSESKNGIWYITNYFEGFNYPDEPNNGIQVYSIKNDTWINEAYRTINILGEVVPNGAFDWLFSKIS